jgi:hypothetical protein
MSSRTPTQDAEGRHPLQIDARNRHGESVLLLRGEAEIATGPLFAQASLESRGAPLSFEALR